MSIVWVFGLLVYMMFGVDWYNMTMLAKLPFVVGLLVAIHGVIKEAME